MWLTDAPAPATRAFWADYPGMTDLAGLLEQTARAGFAPLESFVLPESCWDDYFAPVAARCDELAETAAAPGALAAIADARAEIAMWEAARGEYGYAFVVAEPR